MYKRQAQEKKIKYYHLMTIPTDRKKLLLGNIIYIGYMILFSNVIVFAGATIGGFLLTTHVPVGGDVYKRQLLYFAGYDPL